MPSPVYLDVSQKIRDAVDPPMKERFSSEEGSELRVRAPKDLCHDQHYAEKQSRYDAPLMAVVLATSVAAAVCPLGGTVHNVVRDELGICDQLW